MLFRIFIIVFCGTVAPCFAQPMSITFTGIDAGQGKVYVAVYDRADAFGKPEQARFAQVYPVTRAGTMTIQTPDLPAGAYAISCYYDRNGNGRLDRNVFGVPTEPYAFSNDVRPRLRSATWDEGRFTHQPGQGTVTLRLAYWQ